MLPWLTVPVALLALQTGPVAAADYFRIRVIDEQTGRGVPLVELRTVNSVCYYTDSAGFIAFHEPGLMDQEVHFSISAHGYEYPADGFGYRGVRLKISPGGEATIKIKRLNIAERIYRVTGGAVYRDSVLLGRPVPTERPVLNGLVFGQDSVVNTVYHGGIYWFWGDTSRPAYPLGNFQVAGATSRLPDDGGLPPDAGVDLTYFVDEGGFAREMAPIPGPGPTWIDGLVTLRGADGTERMFAAYAKVRADMTATGRGLLEFDDDAKQLKRIAEFDLKAPISPGGHTFLHDVDGVRHIYYTRPFPVIRVPADPDKLADLLNYECFTCLRPGSSVEEPGLDRDADGALRWAWKRDAPPLIPRVQEDLIKSGRMDLREARFRLHDIQTGKPVIVHGGSVYWNAHRRRWVMIASEIFGTSMLGEIWLAEADTPLGPWRFACKIVTHERYSFYNPKQHPMFDEDDGRVIYFEGTYTSTFSGNPVKTPRYDYNQIMYRLDLADPRTVLPVAVYTSDEGVSTGVDTGDDARPARMPAFFALDRPIPDSVAVYEESSGQRPGTLEARPVDTDAGRRPIFFALPAELDSPPSATAPLYAHIHADGRRIYAVEGGHVPTGFERSGQPVCRVWRDPLSAAQTD